MSIPSASPASPQRTAQDLPTEPDDDPHAHQDWPAFHRPQRFPAPADDAALPHRLQAMKDTRFGVTEPDSPRESAREISEPQSPPVYRASDLTLGGKRALIVLGDQTYTLSITRAGKLILTK